MSALPAAARLFARLAAAGLIAPAEAAAAFAAHPSGPRARAMHDFADRLDHHRSCRARAEQALRTALRPALRAWRPAADLLAIAAAHAGPDLPLAEARAVAAEAAAHALARSPTPRAFTR